jgi:hypothetical protein
MASSLDDLLYNSDDLLDSPEQLVAPPAAVERNAAWVASHCGACFEAGESFVHTCKLQAVRPDHVVPLHAALLCTSVVQPIEGFYFCDMSCLHAYNWEKERLDIVEVMPDDGIPRGRIEYDFQLPARRRPGEQVELPPWAAPAQRVVRRILQEDGEEEAEAAAEADGAVVAAEAAGGAAEEVAAEAEANMVPAKIGTRFVLDGEHGVVVKIITQSGTIIVAYDDGQS